MASIIFEVNPGCHRSILNPFLRLMNGETTARLNEASWKWVTDSGAVSETGAVEGLKLSN
ncbi:MAG: hypothetical protein ABJ360_08750 [Roseobacter sp.]